MAAKRPAEWEGRRETIEDWFCVSESIHETYCEGLTSRVARRGASVAMVQDGRGNGRRIDGGLDL